MLKWLMKKGFLFSFVFIISAFLINIIAGPAFGKEKQTKPVTQKKDTVQNRIVSEKILLSTGGKEIIGKVKISPDGRRTGYVSKTYIPKVGDRQFVVIDGKEGEKYEEIVGEIVFSPDSKRIAYIAKRDEKPLVIVDGKEAIQFDNYDSISNLQFSPDSKRIAYTVKKGKRGGGHFIVVDEKESKKYGNIIYADNIFSPDSKRIAFSAFEAEAEKEKSESRQERGKRIRSKRTEMAKERHAPTYFVVVDDEEGKRYHPYIGKPIFSPDSKQIVYKANVAGFGRGSIPVLVINGKEGKQYGSIDENSITFSPNSEHIAYAATDKGSWRMVIDGKEEKNYAYRVENPIFSPDSKRFAYTAVVGGKGESFVVLDGKEGKKFDGIANLTFSPDSNKIAYVAKGANDLFVVINEKDEREYEAVGKPIFSPDGNRVAYVAKKDRKQFIVIDGKEGKKYEKISKSLYRIGSLSHHINWEDADGVYGDEDKKEFPAPTFSPDSKHVVYVATEDKGGQFIVVDGKEGKKYDEIIERKITFDSPDKLHYIAKNGNNFYLIEEKIK